jgi:RNA polymerase sigma-70 factor (ECF subfamily)
LEAFLGYCCCSGRSELYGAGAILLNAGMVSSAPEHAPDLSDPDLSNEDLLVAVGKARSRPAFVRLFEYFAPRVKSFLIKGGLAPDTADEVAQETMFAVWDKAASYDPRRAAASTWIFTIARNKRIDFLRRIGRSQAEYDDVVANKDSGETLPDDIVSHDEDMKALAGAL